jgi:hypothetical protein
VLHADNVHYSSLTVPAGICLCKNIDLTSPDTVEYRPASQRRQLAELDAPVSLGSVERLHVAVIAGQHSVIDVKTHFET